MNRFVKKNITLIGILGLTLLIGVVLFVYAMIVNIQRIGYNEDTDKLVSQINELVTKKPAPVDENKPLIEQDIQLYQKISKNLRDCFAEPMQVPADEFLKTLKTKPGKDEAGKVIPPQTLTREKFLEMFRPEWEQIPAENFPQKEYFLRLFRRRFLNWGEARKAFIAKAKDLTVENVDESNADVLMFSALGFPRLMSGKPEELRRFMENMRNRINELSAEKLVLPYDATQFGFDFTNPGKYVHSDYPLIAKHWDILGDLVKRVIGTGIKMLHGIKIRIRPGEGESLQGSVESVGAYKLYHYTLEVSGPMASIRKLVSVLDLSYVSHRFYLVRSVYLFAEENGAQTFFTQLEAEPEANVEKQEQPTVSRRGRGRGRGRVMEEEQQEESKQKSEEEKKREEEKRREERRKAMEAKLQPHERSGYGNILIGQGEEYRAIIDVDYVVLNQ